jgi:hypothetical protein
MLLGPSVIAAKSPGLQAGSKIELAIWFSVFEML